MIDIKPLITASEADLAVIFGRFIGATLKSVTYRYLPFDEGVGYDGSHGNFDADIAAVVLDLADRGEWTVTWGMDGELEGLAFLSEDAEYIGLTDVRADASGFDGWRRHIGATISSIGIARHVSGQGTAESVWALRLELTTGSVVVALGTFDSDAIDYMPDELVVLFESRLALEYCPSHTQGCAWGETLENLA